MNEKSHVNEAQALLFRPPVHSFVLFCWRVHPFLKINEYQLNFFCWIYGERNPCSWPSMPHTSKKLILQLPGIVAIIWNRVTPSNNNTTKRWICHQFLVSWPNCIPDESKKKWKMKSRGEPGPAREESTRRLGWLTRHCNMAAVSDWWMQ